MDSKKMYPISVEYVFEPEHVTEYPNLTIIRDYCKMMDIAFHSRKYDPLNNFEDKTLIQKLPAVHIYIKNTHAAITYPENALYDIRDVYEKFDIEYMAYLSKKQIWNERLQFLKRMFMRHSSKTDSNCIKTT
jgi:hypothetical protein